MKIRLHSIPEVGGLDVDFSIPAEDIQAASKSASRVDETFIGPVVCTTHLALSEEDVFLRLEAKAPMECLCYRCGESFENTLSANTFLTCAPRTRSLKRGKFGSKDAQMEQDSDEGLVYFDRDEIDLTEIVKEQLLLALPMRYLCKEECAGVAQEII